MELSIKPGMYIESPNYLLNLDSEEAIQAVGENQIAIGDLVIIDGRGFLNKKFSKRQAARIAKKLKGTGWKIPDTIGEMNAIMDMALAERTVHHCDAPEDYGCEPDRNLNLYGGHFFIALDGSFSTFDFHDGAVRFSEEEYSRIELFRE